MKYNVSHIKLLKLIRNNKIKNGTKIFSSDFEKPLYFEDDNLYFINKYGEKEYLSFNDFIGNIRYGKFKIENE